MRILHNPARGDLMMNLSVTQLRAALAEGSGVLWVDLNGDAVEAAEDILANVFNFHPLAIDDAINEVHLPKLDDWKEYLYLVVRGLDYELDAHRPSLPELDMFIGRNYLVTFHHEQIPAVDRVWDAFAEDERLQQRNVAYVLYRILDELVDQYITTVEALEDRLEHVEDQILLRPDTASQERILVLKHVVLRLRRVTSLQRETLNKLARDQFAVLDSADQVYFRDVYDHMIRLYELIDGLRDLVMGALDLYLSAINNRMNEIMKTLTVITTLFMPLTFVTGFFGMNFFQPVLAELAPWTGRAVFTLTLLAMFMLPFVMFLWMRRRAWM